MLRASPSPMPETRDSNGGGRVDVNADRVDTILNYRIEPTRERLRQPKS
jgi:hypothetical protein